MMTPSAFAATQRLGGSGSMEADEIGMIVLVVSLVLVGGLVVPMAAIALHQRKRRAHERAAGLRRKEKIRL
jgi:hypothetical protein